MVTVSYGVMIKHCDRVFDKTMEIYRAAVSYLIDIALRHYDELLLLQANGRASLQQTRRAYMENLIHTTKEHAANISYSMNAFTNFHLISVVMPSTWP